MLMRVNQAGAKKGHGVRVLNTVPMGHPEEVAVGSRALPQVLALEDLPDDAIGLSRDVRIVLLVAKQPELPAKLDAALTLAPQGEIALPLSTQRPSLRAEAERRRHPQRQHHNPSHVRLRSCVQGPQFADDLIVTLLGG